jgi:hypothetical protein
MLPNQLKETTYWRKKFSLRSKRYANKKQEQQAARFK